MQKISVLVVDDSALMRQLLSKMIDQSKDLMVVGTAADANQAREKIKKFNPQVITLDVHMPGMDGIVFLEKLMRLHPMPVVMVSAYTQSGSETTLKALELGAVDFIGKPQLKNELDMQNYSQELVEKIKTAALAKLHINRHLHNYAHNRSALQLHANDYKANISGADNFNNTLPSNIPTNIHNHRNPAHASHLLNDLQQHHNNVVIGTNNNICNICNINNIKPHTRQYNFKSKKIIAVGASTGGTEALKDFLMVMPKNCPPILIVQHMPEHFTASFAERLNKLCQPRVIESQGDERISEGTVYIAPGHSHLLFQAGFPHRTALSSDPPVNRHRPSVDVLFSSLIPYAPNVVAVILTGMGKDGAASMLKLAQAGALTLGQDEKSCVVYGMPREAFSLGAVQEQCSIEKIGERALELCCE